VVETHHSTGESPKIIVGTATLRKRPVQTAQLAEFHARVLALGQRLYYLLTDVFG
jgi:hypothetical protein